MLIFKDFSNGIDNDIKECDLLICCTMKCVNFWKICTTQWTNTFEKTNAWQDKNHTWVKDPIKAQDRPADFNVTGYIMFTDMVSKSTLQLTFKKLSLVGLPWWRSGWESACQCRGHGFKPQSGKIPHAAEQLGPWATITEPVRLEPVLCNKRGRNNERPAHRDEEWPPLEATRESPRTETKTLHSHK